MVFLEYLKANVSAIYAVIAIAIAIVVNIFFGLSSKPGSKKISLIVALLSIGTAVFLAIYSFITSGVYTSLVVAFNPIHLAEMVLVLFIAANLLIFLTRSHYNRDSFTKVILIFLFSLVSLLMLVLSRNFLAILVTWSVFTLSNFMLFTGISEKDERPYIVKFFLGSGFALLLMLTGFSYLYSVTDFKNLQQVLESASMDNPMYGFSFLFILAAALLFMCIYPFHGNYLKLVKRADSSVDAIIWVYYLPAGLIILLKFREVGYHLLNQQQELLSPVILAVAAICILGPSIGALTTRSIKRVLGFLYISFIGLALLAFSLFSSQMISASRTEWLILATILNMALCLIPVWFIFSRLPDSLDSLRGFMKQNTYLGINLLIIMLSWIGVPGTAGYLLRDYMLGPLVLNLKEGSLGSLPAIDLATLAVVIAAFLIIAANIIRLVTIMFSTSSNSSGGNLYYHRAYYIYITLFTLLVLAVGIWGLLELTGGVAASSISIINPQFLKPLS